MARREAIIADGPARYPARRDPRLPLVFAIGCVALVGVDLRPGIVSMGPLLVPLRAAFG